MTSTHDIGRASETAVLNRLVQLGMEVLLPWSSHLGYDLAYYVVEEHRNFGFFVHRESRLVRIQVKTARLEPDGCSFVFSTQSVRPKKSHNERNDYVGIAEYIAAYLPSNGKVYMIPVNIAPKNTAVLRFRECGSSSSPKWKGGGRVTWWAEDYEI